MPLAEASVVKENKLFEEVPVAQLNVVKFVDIDKDKLPVGATKELQRTANAPGLVHVMADNDPPPDVNTSPDDPAVVGRLKLYVPAADDVRTVMAPEVAPCKIKSPELPDCPSVNELVPVIAPVMLAPFADTVKPLPTTKASSVLRVSVAERYRFVSAPINNPPELPVTGRAN
ncbi:MAG: hypothetical protein JSS66_04650 [Armatimonadetes bacterium]|nr:hypothetical protein [Armatimonadota bacterium]